MVRKYVTPAMFKKRYADVFKGDPNWRKINVASSKTYGWNGDSTYVQHPPYFEGMSTTPAPITAIKGARLLALLGDQTTTDHTTTTAPTTQDRPAGRPEEHRSGTTG